MNIGDSVTCGTCGKPATIDDLDQGQNGQLGFRLSCNHRNGFCDRHQVLVMDASDTHSEIHPMCDKCIAEEMENEASIPPEYRMT